MIICQNLGIKKNRKVTRELLFQSTGHLDLNHQFALTKDGMRFRV